MLALSAICFYTLAGTGQIKMPAPSSTQTIKQDFGMGAIELTYSRPNAKGRKIFGDLVPYNKLWRTGANTATKIVFNDAVELGGKKIDTGTYVLYTIPGVDSWEIIINKGVKNWGIDGYKESEDVIRFKVEPTKAKGRKRLSRAAVQSCARWPAASCGGRSAAGWPRSPAARRHWAAA